MKDNAHRCKLAGTLENLSFDPLFGNNSEENAPNYEQIPVLILELFSVKSLLVFTRITHFTSKVYFAGQVDSPKLPETPEITEMTENFTKVTKYLTKFKETLINYVWEKSHVKKQ